MTETQGNLASMSRYIFHTPGWYTSLAYAVGVAGIAGVGGFVGTVLMAGGLGTAILIDVLDPAFAPGTGTPVWGGLASWQAAALLQGLAGLDIRGGDVVEVAPPFDTTGATAIAGAHAAVEMLCLIGQARCARATGEGTET